MADWTAEKFTQRITELGLVDPREMEKVWREVGGTDASLDEVVAATQRLELMTNLQVDRVLRGERLGFFYGKWKIQYLIGTGTFARVYRAVHRDSKEVRAVKVLRKRHRENMTELEQFLREGKMGAQLRHVNVVPIYEVASERFAPYMVMEFVEGENLRDLIKMRPEKKFTVKETVHFITEIAQGLAYAAEKGITHRDLKMSNVLIASNGRAKLVDFGLAAASNLQNEEELADCPNARAIDYATLERGTGVRKDDIRSDIYFTGCIMYHCLTGVPPLYETKDRLQRLSFTRFRDIKPIHELAPDLPHAVIQFLNRCMELDPTKRFNNPSHMLHEARQMTARIENANNAAGSDTADAEQKAAGNEADKPAAESRPTTVVEHEGEGRTVLLVEAQAALQDALRDQLKKRGYRVLITTNPDMVFRRFEDDAHVADAVVFSTSELEDAALDAFNRFGEHEDTKTVPAILLVDPREKGMIAQAQTAPHRRLLPLPLKVRNLRAALVKLLSRAPSAAN